MMRINWNINKNRRKMGLTELRMFKKIRYCRKGHVLS